MMKKGDLLKVGDTYYRILDVEGVKELAKEFKSMTFSGEFGKGMSMYHIKKNLTIR